MLTNGTLYILIELLLVVSSAIMLLSIVSGRKIVYLVNEQYRRRWKILLWLMVFFLGCYIFSIVAVGHHDEPIRTVLLPEIVGVVFFFGAIFVYLVVRIGYSTIKDMESSIIELSEALKNRDILKNEIKISRDKLAKQNDALNDLTRNILGKNTIKESACQLAEKTAQILDVGRVSIWLYDTGKTYIRCIDLYERELKRHSEDMKLFVKDYPAYFNAIESRGILDVNDVFSDPRTSELADYFKPIDITSLLDIPVFQEGKLKGIICCEHTGDKRKWSIEEKSFGSSLADIMAISMETFDRQKTEKELEISLSLTRATIESTADGILVVDNEGKISGFNQQFIRMWHIPPELVNKTSDKEALEYVLNQLDDPSRFMNKVQELYANPDLESSDYLEFKDGRVFERYSKPQILHDKIIGRVWSFRDITRQKQDEEKIRQLNAELEGRVRARTKEALALNEELKANIKSLEMANKELEAFTYSVSHDLRAPLRAINGFINVLEQKYGDTASPEARLYMSNISKNARKMGQLIDDLLSFSRIGKKELEKVKIDTNELVTEILADINIIEWNPKTKVIRHDLLPVIGDRALVKQAFYNVISNAVKYSHMKEEPVIEISSHINGTENVYVVRDNGVGFSMEYYDKLFKVFQRLNSSPDFEGVGVGLAIVERIISRHGGRVWAESKEGEGATFYMAFPNNVEPGPVTDTGTETEAAKKTKG